ncbi:MAG: tetratricopeptide repeat protein [Chloroflexi bacterium]|nr:tetratricopeptide repeat protein [Chloroflexota bacterium]
MTRLSILLLGPLQVTLDGQPVTGFETEKARALLAYLALEADRPHRREFLAELLWPERPQGAAQANLRHTLAGLRRAICDPATAPDSACQAAPPFLLVTRTTIQLNRAGDVYSDAAAFTALLGVSSSKNPPALAALEEAVGLYRGAFLEDISVMDCPDYEDWLLITREQMGRLALEALLRLAEEGEQSGDYARALPFARRSVQIEPWNEAAQRQVMRLLAFTGQRTAALAQYEICRRVLAEELGLEPEPETLGLRRRILDGELTTPPPLSQLPAFLREDAPEVAPPVFVAREQQLAQLRTWLDQALTGHGCVAFVSGVPGQGKTALLGEFARRSQATYPNLLVAKGNCSAISGVGDPYLPFRDVMAMLSGDLENRWAAGAISRAHARRLWAALPAVLPALLAHGSTLIGPILPGEALLARARRALPDEPARMERLRTLTARAQVDPAGLEQSFLFDQYFAVLHEVARQHPLLLVLDDFQWADNASVSLLFHLARRLCGAPDRILIVCAYRPEEVALGRGGERHPLEPVLHEIQRTCGDVWVYLDATDAQEGRSFVDALLDSERNRLGVEFRAALFDRTAGQPLFTVELLRAMRERGELVPDVRADGAWIAGPALDWERLPAQVEAVIQERVARLDPETRAILNVGSVEGEQFTAPVIAAVTEMAEPSVLRALRKLERLFRLVKEAEEGQAGVRRLARYQFSHILLQEYLYQQLSQGERRLLHGQVASVLARLYQGQPDAVAARLAYHFCEAGDYGAAFRYTLLTAEAATRAYAHHDAIAFYTRGIELAPQAAVDADALVGLYRGRGRAYEISGAFERARADYETALQLSRAAGRRHDEWRALLDLAKLWTSRDYDQSRHFAEQAVSLARDLGEPAVLAASLNWMGNWYTNAEQPVVALGYHREALQIFEQLKADADVAQTLDLLGITALIHGDLTAGVEYYQRAIARFHALGDRAGLAACLTGRGLAGGGASVNLASPAPLMALDARRDLEEALHIAQEIDSPAAQAWALWALGLVLMGQGQLGQALESVRSTLALASAIGHREWLVGGQAVLGTLYVDLLAPEEAQPHLEQALALARQLRSQHWIHAASSALAAAWRLRGDPARALAYLTPILAGNAAMDTVHRRACWIRRAELALAQGDAPLALDIADRLIASAPGLAPGQVIPLLWLLKADALAATGQVEPARVLLQAALNRAQALEDRFLLWRIHASLGRAYAAMPSQPEAKQQFAAARRLVEELAQTLSDPELRDTFLHRAYRTISTSL